MREILVGLVIVVDPGGPARPARPGRRRAGLPHVAGGRSTWSSATARGSASGSPVRIAGLDAGRVVDIDLTEIEGTLWRGSGSRCRRSWPSKLRQDVKVTIQASLAGQSRVNIVSSGRSAVALVPGQVVQGVESTFFDPILEQVGLGPGRAEPPEPHDRRGPRRRSTRSARGSGRSSARSRRRRRASATRPTRSGPAVEATAGHVEDLARRISASTPKIEAALTRLDTLTAPGRRACSPRTAPTSRPPSASVRDLTGHDQGHRGQGPGQGRAAARRPRRHPGPRRPRPLPGRPDRRPGGRRS